MSGTGRVSERRARRRRSLGALALASVAFGCAAIAALLPAEHLQTTYSWPPQNLSAPPPDRAWYTPLLLARHQADSISVRLPCDVPRPLRRATRPVVVMATARDAPSVGGLRVTHVGRELVGSVGGDEIVRLALPPPGSPAARCTYRLVLADGGWSVEGGTRSRLQEGRIAMPVVSGLFSSVDLGRQGRPSIEVTTTVYGSKSTAVQAVLRSVAALAALSALILISLSGAVRQRIRLTARPVRRVASKAAPVDLVVAVALLGWWLIGPAFFDDGWVVAVQENFGATGQLSTYYDSYGVGSSLQYWLVWAQHWLFDSSNALLVLRIPALVCLAATWVLCRWIFSRLSAVSTPAGQWALATAFLTGAFAWGMTVRPEPVLALLVTGVVACTLLFVERNRTAPLAVAAILIVLAVSAHPAGLVALAPLVVMSRTLFDWARTRLATVATIILASAALLAVLAFLGSDVWQFRAEVASLRAFGAEVAGWRDELTRYSLLSRDSYGAPLRRAWVALALLAVLAFILRPHRRATRSMPDVPAAALGVAFILLIPTPAKLPWHFGALIGLAALALASETARLVEAGRRDGWSPRPFVVIGAAMLAAAWSWFPRNTWGDLDLRTMDWTFGVEQRVTFAKAAGIAPLLLLGVLAVIELARRREPRRLHEVPWRAATLTVPVVALPLIAFTIAVFVADTARTSSWTLLRQNTDALRGDGGCGLADDSVVSVLESMRPLAGVGATRFPAPAPWLPLPPVPGLPRLALAPQSSVRPGRSPWFRLPSGQRVGFFLTGIPSSDETIELEWGRIDGARVRPAGAAQVASDIASDARPELRYWRFYADGDLPPAPAGANAVRFLVRTRGPQGAGIGFTAPVTYTNETLTSMLERERPSLVLPNLRVYFPCVEAPVVRGIVSVPAVIVGFRHSMWPLGTGTSPFDQTPALYPLVRLPLSDSPDPPEEVAVYIVQRRLDGAAVAAPVSTAAG